MHYFNLCNKTSQPGNFTFMPGSTENNPQIFRMSYMFESITCPILEIWEVALSNAYDMNLSLQCSLEKILSKYVSLGMMTENQSLFDLLTRATRNTNNRLIIYMESARGASLPFKINYFDLVKRKYKIVGAHVISTDETFFVKTFFSHTEPSDYTLDYLSC